MEATNVSVADAPAGASPDTVPVVAIGASAGGLTALEVLFEQLPANTDAAFVVVQHLSPDYQSHMPELLGRRTKMDTVQLVEAIRPVPNTVYLLPPGKHVVYQDDELRLQERELGGELNLPIDKFFDSLGKNGRGPIAAMVLSGTGSDGSIGITTVHRAGGLVLSQDEDTAQFNSMPLNAIKTEAVHIVAPVAELADALVSYLGGTPIQDVIAQSSPTIERNDLDAVYTRLESACGVNFGQYKHGTFTRRLSRRMMLSKIDQLDRYVDMLDRDETEISRLADDLMIGVTRFFRDPDGYTRLTKRAIRPIIAKKKDGDEVRVWIAGCATGQEAYSVAMLVHEEVRASDTDLEIKIFATDVHPDAIRFAQGGVYPADSLSEIPRHLRDFYTSEHAEGFEINRTVRESVVFARHDVLRDAPFTNLDLLTCRNLLIYLVDEAQARVLNLFSHALVPRGVMWLGPSETPGEAIDDFIPLDKQWRLFQKNNESSLPMDLKLRRRPLTNATMSLRPRSSRTPSAAMIQSYDTLLERYGPPGILVDDALHTLQTFGDLSGLTSAPSGRTTGTVEDILVEPLRMPLAIAFQRMRLNEQATESEQAIFDDDLFEVRVERLASQSINEAHFFVSFHREKDYLKVDGNATDKPPLPLMIANSDVVKYPTAGFLPALSVESERQKTERLRMVEMELDFTRENLQATIEEVETTNEELQSSNEELTSSNEELQSTNEELHSVNEELHTTNAESNRRLQQLTELTEDLEAVMRESEIGIVLIDNDLAIRRMTPPAAEVFDMTRKNVDGVSILQYASAFRDVQLVPLLQQSRDENTTIECEVSDRRGDPLLLRIRPYRDHSGIVITLTNLRGIRETNARLRKLTSIVEDSPDAIIGVDLDGRVTSWNRGATRLFDNKLDVDQNVELCDVIPESVWTPCDSLIRELARKGEVSAKEIQVEIERRKRTLLIRVTPVLDEFERVAAAAITLYDVTAIRKAESDLELRTRAIETASNGFTIVDALDHDLPIIYANQGFTKLTGFSPEHVVGRNCRFLQGPKTDPKDLELIRKAVREKTPCRVTLLNYRRDGSEFYNELVITPIKNAEDRVTHFVGVQSDVTDVVMARRTLERSELEYRSTFENAAIGIAHIGLNGQWLRVNQKLCEIVGYPLDELVEKSFQDITHADDLDMDLLQFAQMKRGEISGYSMEKRYLHRDGHVVWINLTTSLRRTDTGEPDCCISLIEDISDRKETEQKLSASRAIITEVIQQSADPFISFDDDGVIIAANPAANKLTPVHGDLVGRSYERLFENESNSPLLLALDRVRRSQNGETTEFYSRHLNRWYDARVFPIDGGAAVYLTDVTVRKETENYLEQARKAAEEASQAKSKFLTNMSHEIRSPMSAILGFSDLTLRDLREGKSVDPKNVETVIRNGRFLLRIINDILDLSKVEAGKLEVRRTRFKLLPMLTDINELMRHRCTEHGVPMSIEFASPISERLRSDRSRVEQILVNLIGNAIKFTPDGSVRVVVDMDPEDSTMIRFQVIDTGIGISEDNLSRLFQTFSQVHDRKLVGVEGTGLGLVISQRLAGLLGGDIRVASVVGEGSTFTLRLPIEDDANRIQATAGDLVASESETDQLTAINARVLVADDARDVRLVTTRFLARAGADVVEAINGAEAVRAVRQAESNENPFACVLMDMQMPELDGREATEKLRNAGFTMPIIALTAGATQDEIDRALAAGCTEFVAKPVNASDLVDRVAKLTR